ncbi:SGNH/GDSL hydrolase family protein [Lewinella sp. W8]|uniref:SGNH/GDSL hydrolase family protein n=1 Tax=Lewinella sp. W8 TaxID=2528208 RepID=UPI001067C765|nr:SGNH/GDSL hydrolase family protein [Lewinella sp. W8]MTB52213.1 SGNH/GDSL hydrolase family protein [Lewinella sp. W8]
MKTTLKYLAGAGITLPLLPVMYRQAMRVKARVPILPEAETPFGTVRVGDTPTFRVILIGESTLAGVGVNTHEEGFAGTLGHAISRSLGRSVSWRVYARSGYTASRKLERLLPKIREEHADLIVIGTGGNDAFKLSTPWGFRRAAGKMMDRLRERFPRAPIAFTNMPPIRDFPAFTPLIQRTIGSLVELHGEALEAEVTNRPNVYFNHEILHLEEWANRLGLPPDPKPFFSDGVHPSRLTYQTWAQDFAEFLQREGIV